LSWKRSQNNTGTISSDSIDQRSSYRVRPLSTEPIRIEFKGKTLFVKDISAGGLSFCNDNFAAGDSQLITLDLPGKNVTITAKTEVIKIDRQGVCHCRFVGLSDDLVNAIHRYVMAVQVEEMREKRRDSRKISQPGDMTI